MYPIKSIGLLWDAKTIPATRLTYDADVQKNGNAVFGSNCANAVYCGASGNVEIILANGKDTILFVAVAGGIWVGMPPFVHVTANTTATGVCVGVTAG